MADLFKLEPAAPLAEALRPATLDEVIGQSHLLGAGKPLRLAFESGKPHSMILWGVNEWRRHEITVSVDFLRCRRGKCGRYLHDETGNDANINAIAAIRQRGVSDDQIHQYSPLQFGLMHSGSVAKTLACYPR